jgi:hypothetical protein
MPAQAEHIRRQSRQSRLRGVKESQEAGIFRAASFDFARSRPRMSAQFRGHRPE